MKHQFKDIGGGRKAYEIEINEPEMLEKFQQVIPRNFPVGHMLIPQWLPPKLDLDGKPTSIGRLRFLVAAVGKNGPELSAITRILDDADAPKVVGKVQQIEVPKVIQAIDDENVLDDAAAKMGVRYASGTPVDVKKMLIASECSTNPRARQHLQAMEDSLRMAAQGQQPPQAPKPQPATAGVI